ncbi:hypothetical protein AVEN_108213-1 [Araneus ventricosus]|uniref:Gustatory receptor n=1 Tax=Araneus ventricosus TaxID=182803 RepID=A0A4Y2I3L0_ARAVE|nr:hypothetical protein AVEN_108213-1 [Araneus ventricosus]
MRAKKRIVRKICDSLQQMPCNNQLKKLNFVAFLIVCLHIIYCLPSVVYVTDLKGYGHGLENEYLRILLTSLKLYIDFLSYPGLTCLVALFYCTSCLHCSKGIQNLTEEINKFSDDSFTPTVQIGILKRKMKIDNALDEIQGAFSTSSFLVIASGFLSFSHMIGYMLIIDKEDDYTGPAIFTITIRVITSCSSMIGTLWTAGGIPVDLNRLKESFYRKAHSRYITHQVEELHIKRELLEKPDFVLSGCDIVSYRRGSILVVADGVLSKELNSLQE